jgi:hypothetical protein
MHATDAAHRESALSPDAECIVALLSVLTVLFVLCLNVAILVGLGKDWDVAQRCPGSHLNAYGVVVVVFSFVALCCTARSRHSKFFRPRLGVHLLLAAAEHAWGFVELYARACTHSGTLWTSLAVNAWANAVYILVIVSLWVADCAMVASTVVTTPASPPAPQPSVANVV